MFDYLIRFFINRGWMLAYSGGSITEGVAYFEQEGKLIKVEITSVSKEELDWARRM